MGGREGRSGRGGGEGGEGRGCGGWRGWRDCGVREFGCAGGQRDGKCEESDQREEGGGACVHAVGTGPRPRRANVRAWAPEARLAPVQVKAAREVEQQPGRPDRQGQKDT